MASTSDCLGVLAVACSLLALVLARGPPVVTSRYNDRQIARIGRPIRLDCPVEGQPAPLLQWSKDGESIHRGWERFKVLSTSGLRIKDVVQDDAGIYVCKATNGFGHVTVEYQLFVFPDNNDTVTLPAPDAEGRFTSVNGKGEPPQFIKADQMRSNSHVLRPVGSSVRLKCKATGRPRPTISWFHNGVFIPQDPEMLGALEDDDEEYDDYEVGDEHARHNRYSLRLSKLKEEDNGLYTCKVYNRAGAINHTYTVEVVESTKAKPVLVPPHPMNSTVAYGNMATFLCQVRSIVQPHIQWLKRVDNANIVSDKNRTIEVNDQEFIVLKTGRVMSRQDGSYLNKLTIYHATEKDAGMYICLGANSVGYSVRSAFLFVLPQLDTSHERNASEEPSSTSFILNLSIPVILGIVGAMLLLIIGIIVCVLKRQRRINRKNVAMRTARPQPPPVYPPNVHPEKAYEHQYAALQPQPQPYQLHRAASRERIMKTYSDMHSDISYPPAKSITPLPPAPPPSQQQQPMPHVHYYSRT